MALRFDGRLLPRRRASVTFGTLALRRPGRQSMPSKVVAQAAERTLRCSEGRDSYDRKLRSAKALRAMIDCLPANPERRIGNGRALVHHAGLRTTNAGNRQGRVRELAIG